MKASKPVEGLAPTALPLLEVLLRITATGVVVCDMRAPGQPIVFVNEAFERLTGYSAEEALGRNCNFLQGPETAELARSLLRGAIERGEPITATLLNYRRDGTSFYNEVRLSPVSPPGGGPPHYYAGLMADVTERVAAESDLANAEVLRSTVFNAMVEGIMVLDSAGHVVDANPSALELLGIERQDLERPDWWHRLEVRDVAGRPLEPSDSPGGRAFQEQRRILGTRLLVRRGDGVDRLVAFNYEPLTDRFRGEPQGLVVSLRDETDRERSIEELERFAALVEISDDFIAIAALDGSVEYVNRAGRRLVGLDSVGQARAVTIRDFLTDEGWQASSELEQPAVREHGYWKGESTLRHFKTGEAIPVRINSYLVRHPETGVPLAMATVQRDISEEKRFTEELVRSRERYEAQFRGLPLPTYVWQRQGEDLVLVDWNETAEEMTRGAIAGRRGTTAADFWADLPELLLACERCWARRGRITQELPYRMRTTGELKHLIITFAWVPPDLVLVHALDISDRVRSERELLRLTERDDLTGHYNRRYFERVLSESLGTTDLGVLIVDIDHFKFVNDSLGHGAGDELLREVADTMAARLRPGDVLARLGGDEFAVLLPGADADRTRTAAGHLLGAIRSGVTGVSVTASSGAAVFTGDAKVSASEAIVAADIALYEAKQRGRDRVELYAGQAGQSLTWLEQIRDAIKEDRLLLYGQPVVSLRGAEQPPTYELLVRMTDRRGELIPPGSFLPTAERFGLIRDIDRWVVARGIEFAARGHRVSINLSARSLGDPALTARVAELLQRTGADPQDITFEFTETAAVSSVEDARACSEALTQMGCATALDDFGTGFGTFILLKHLPVSALKIDIEFVRCLSTSSADQRIVRSIVQMARDAGMRTVAEGVEDAGTLALLRELGVDWAQGYHIARPAPLPW